MACPPVREVIIPLAKAQRPGPEVIQLFMLSSTEYELSTAHKTKILTNEDVSCFESLRCCIYHANTLKDFKNAKNENYYFLDSDNF